MGVDDAIRDAARVILDVADSAARASDSRFVFKHMTAGRCREEFLTAYGECNPETNKRRVDGVSVDKKPGEEADGEACRRATAALRRCMQENESAYWGYLQDMEKGLDEDEGKRARDPSYPWRGKYRWWTGMRRT